MAGDEARVGRLALVEVRVHNPMPAASRFAKHGRTNQLIEGGCHFTAALRALAEGGRGVGSDPVVAVSGSCSHVSKHMVRVCAFGWGTQAGGGGVGGVRGAWEVRGGVRRVRDRLGGQVVT